MAKKVNTVKKATFAEALAGIQAEDFPVARVLEALNDMTPTDFKTFQVVWPTIPDDRRSDVMHALLAVNALEEGYKFDFTAIFRLALADPDERVRIYGVEGLEPDDSPLLINIFARMMREDTSEIVKAACATALGKYLYLGELEELAKIDRDKAYSALMGALLVAPRNSLFHHRVIESIGFADNEETRTILAEAHDSESEDLRLSAITAMGRSGNQLWAPRLLADMVSDSAETRGRAAWACGETFLDDATGELGRLIREDHDQEVQLAAIEALGEIASDDARALLKRATDSKDEELALAAEEALENAEMLGDVRQMLDTMDEEDLAG